MHLSLNQPSTAFYKLSKPGKHSDNNKKGKVVLLPEGESAANSTVRLKVNLDAAASENVTAGDKHFLKRDSAGLIKIEKVNDNTDFDDTYKFEVVAGSDDKYIRLRQLGNGNKDKFMMVDFNNDKTLKIQTYTQIDDACTAKSLDFLLSASEQDITDCSDTTGSSD